MSESESTDLTQVEGDQLVRQVCANGVCMKTDVVEGKLDEGNIQEAESALRDGLSLNFEVGFVKTYEFNYFGESTFLQYSITIWINELYFSLCRRILLLFLARD